MLFRSNIFPQLKYYERLKIFNTLNQKLKSKYDVNLILALLLLDGSNDYEYFCHKYKTSNIIKSRFKNISENFENLKSKKFYLERNIKKLIYLSNKNDARDLLLFSICRSEEHTSELQSRTNLVCRLLLEKKKKKNRYVNTKKKQLNNTNVHYTQQQHK